MQDLWFVPPSDFLTRLDAQDRADLLSRAKLQRVPRGEFVFRAGSPGRQVYILKSGHAKIYQVSPLGKDVILWFCFQGELFGLAELSREGSREVFAQACSDLLVYAICKEDFRHFLETHPKGMFMVVELLSCRLRVLGDVLLNLATDDVNARVIKLITRLSARFGRRVGETVQLDIHLTHQEMADMIGASRQSVSTALGDLRKRGILRIENHRIQIESEELLEAAARDAAQPAAARR